MSIIRIFNSAVPGEREIGVNEVNVVSMKMDYDGAPYMLFEHEDFPLNEVQIHDQKIDANGRPYILFEHKDYPLGGLYAWFDGTNWECDLN